MKAVSHCVVLIAVLLLGGCRLRHEPDPNDPNQVSAERQPYVIRDYMKQLSEVVNDSVANKDISPQRGIELTASEAKAYMDEIRFKSTPANEESLVAQGYITAQEWDKAKARLDRALPVDRDPDSQVNDRLRYARCLAELGDVDGAIKNARAAFSAPPEWKWPILYSVYLEIVPTAAKQKPSALLDLAQLVQDAIAQHQQATGDLNNPHQAAWLVARAHHIDKAWELVINLYTQAGKPDLAKVAAAKRAAVTQPTKAIEA